MRGGGQRPFGFLTPSPPSMLETDRQDIVRSPKRKGKHALNAPKMPQDAPVAPPTPCTRYKVRITSTLDSPP